MHSELFYKIGGALQFLTAIIFGVITLDFLYLAADNPSAEKLLELTHLYKWDRFEIYLQSNQELLTGLGIGYSVFLLFASFTNVLIGRSGMPLGQYRSFVLINIVTWGLMVIVNFKYFIPPSTVLHSLFFLAFVLAFFTKPKFQ
jgi:hypothetical protein